LDAALAQRLRFACRPRKRCVWDHDIQTHAGRRHHAPTLLKSLQPSRGQELFQAAWTMAAKAAEYPGSAAIDRTIAENPASLEAWVNRQLVLDPVVMDEPSDEAAAAE
jgi:hypothetical protein